MSNAASAMLNSRHAREQLARWTCLVGRDAYAPGANCNDGPSFMSKLPRPLMTTMSSFAVCQCHGTLQPEANFSSTHAGPKRGLPRRIAADEQLGMLGIGSNLSVAGFTAAISPSSAA